MERAHSPTASQTAGPFFDLGFAHLCGATVLEPRDGDVAVTVHGRVLDGKGAPVPDAAIEIWQAGRDGRHASDDSGFARIHTDDSGAFAFTTIRPRQVPGPSGETHAPHLAVTIFARGLLKHLATRMYFPDNPANHTDPVLALVPSSRRGTLIAQRLDETEFAWNIVLQGSGETVFFTW
jgi:protocatechuate 3,4-dioxygenase alpha subunit